VPGREIFPVLIEDLDPRVVAVAHEQAAALIHRDAARRPEFAGRVSGLPQALMNFPSFEYLMMRSVDGRLPRGIGVARLFDYPRTPAAGVSQPKDELADIKSNNARSRLGQCNL
jgi:hypothetical protein